MTQFLKGWGGVVAGLVVGVLVALACQAAWSRARPGPKPTDPLVIDLQRLYAADQSKDKERHRQALADFYRGPAKVAAADESLTTTAKLYARLRTDVRKALPDTALREVRTRLAQEYLTVLPAVDATLTAEDRAEVAALFDHFALALEFKDGPQAPRPPPAAAAPAGSFGWLNRPAEAARVRATLKSPDFAAAGGRRLMQATPEGDALLYQASIRVTGGTLPPHDQDGTGCCVGEGTAGAVNLLQCVEIALGGEAAEYKPVSSAAVYALSREVAGILGQGDGSYGSAAAKAIETLGTVDCETAQDDPTKPHPHAEMAKKWGRTGLPAALKAVAKKHLVKTASMVRSADEVKAALQNGYPVFICSNVGFEGRGGFRRDDDGRCYRGGDWPHCMYVCGYRADKQWFCIVQSWGKAPPGPRTLGQPESSFWISREDMDLIARQGDSFAVSGYDGFPAQRLDWIVRAVDPVRDALARLTLRRPGPAAGLAP